MLVARDERVFSVLIIRSQRGNTAARETQRRPRYRVVTLRTFDKRATLIHPEGAEILRITRKYSYSDYERCFSDARRFS